MAQNELTDDEIKTVESILELLAGYTVAQADAIIKRALRELRERAVIE